MQNGGKGANNFAIHTESGQTDAYSCVSGHCSGTCLSSHSGAFQLPSLITSWNYSIISEEIKLEGHRITVGLQCSKSQGSIPFRETYVKLRSRVCEVQACCGEVWSNCVKWFMVHETYFRLNSPVFWLSLHEWRWSSQPTLLAICWVTFLCLFRLIERTQWYWHVRISSQGQQRQNLSILMDFCLIN